MSFANKRISTDACIVLQNAGYTAKHINYHQNKPQTVLVHYRAGGEAARLQIADGCVDNSIVEELLAGAKVRR